MTPLAASSTLPPPSDHLSTLEAARVLGMAVRSVQLMVDRGQLQAWKTPGGHRRITRESVERWRQGERKTGEFDSRGHGRATRSTSNQGGGNRVRLLLIEDSVHFQNLVSLLLSKQFADTELQIADDGIVGLAMVGQYQPHVLIVDILLPGIDGATLITSLRSHSQFRQMELIVITSLDQTQLAPYAFALEGVPVVHKPRLATDFPPLLAQAVERSRQRQQVAP